MLFFLKNAKSKQLEDALAGRQRSTGPAAAWAGLPEDELFTPAGFRAEEAEATASSNYSYWGSTLRSFLKNKFCGGAARRPGGGGGLRLFAAPPAGADRPQLLPGGP